PQPSPTIDLSLHDALPICTATTSDTWLAGVGISGLVYVGRYESLRTYVAPRIAYSRSTLDSNAAGTLAGSGSSSTTWSTSGSFGDRKSTRLNSSHQIISYA